MRAIDSIRCFLDGKCSLFKGDDFTDKLHAEIVQSRERKQLLRESRDFSETLAVPPIWRTQGERDDDHGGV